MTAPWGLAAALILALAAPAAGLVQGCLVAECPGFLTTPKLHHRSQRCWAEPAGPPVALRYTGDVVVVVLHARADYTKQGDEPALFVLDAEATLPPGGALAVQPDAAAKTGTGAGTLQARAVLTLPAGSAADVAFVGRILDPVPNPGACVFAAEPLRVHVAATSG